MLVTTQTTLAIQCSHCDKLSLHTLSRFNFKAHDVTKLICECGNDLIYISRKSKGQYQFALVCPICEVRHTILLAGNSIWTADRSCVPLLCENTNVEIGFIGDIEEVSKCVKRVTRSLRDIAEELGYDKYFVNADIMYQVLELVRSKLEADQIYCSCNKGQLSVEIYPDRLELCCSYCEATGLVFAETSKDLQKVLQLGNVQLEANAFQYLDRKSSSRQKNFKDKDMQ